MQFPGLCAYRETMHNNHLKRTKRPVDFCPVIYNVHNIKQMRIATPNFSFTLNQQKFQMLG